MTSINTVSRRTAPALVVSALAFAPSAHAAEPLGPSLCGALKGLIPEIRTHRPEVARARLVLALTDKYENEQLHKIWAQIDPITTSTCPKEREAMLGIVKTKSLGDALR